MNLHLNYLNTYLQYVLKHLNTVMQNAVQLQLHHDQISYSMILKQIDKSTLGSKVDRSIHLKSMNPHPGLLDMHRRHIDRN